MYFVGVVMRKDNWCRFCNNRSSHYALVLDFDDSIHLCEYHYLKIVDGVDRNIPRCHICNTPGINKNGDPRLVSHHVNYQFDITIDICDRCHSYIHNTLQEQEGASHPLVPEDSRISLDTGNMIDKKYNCNEQYLEEKIKERNFKQMHSGNKRSGGNDDR